MKAALLTALSIASGTAHACELPAAADRLDSARFTIAIATDPAAIAVGEFFAVALAVCPKSGEGMPESVRVDASMPEHRHGMNYRPRIAGEGGRYRAEGLMFHMTGRWEFVVEIRAAGRTERATLSRRIE